MKNLDVSVDGQVYCCCLGLPLHFQPCSCRVRTVMPRHASVRVLQCQNSPYVVNFDLYIPIWSIQTGKHRDIRRLEFYFYGYLTYNMLYVPAFYGNLQLYQFTKLLEGALKATVTYYTLYSFTATCGGLVGWGTALQVGRSRVRFPMGSLEFFIDIILPDAL
jgi:hypothetical protein